MRAPAKKEFLSFLNIANRSLVETEYLLEILGELNFMDEITCQRLEKQRNEVGVMLKAFSKAVRAKSARVIES